jgi:hypothetical protein
MPIPIHPLTNSYVHQKHLELAKQLIRDKKFDIHHQMSVKLQKTTNLYEFNAVLDEYSYSSTNVGPPTAEELEGRT